MSRIAILGAGAWGTALAMVLTRNSRHTVRLWAYEPEVRNSIATDHENSLYLPGFKIPSGVTATNSLAEALEAAEIVVSVMPSNHCRNIFEQALPHLSPQTLLVSATKGIEKSTYLRMSEVIRDVFRNAKGCEPRVGALSGPSFASEVAKGDPTAITIASPDTELAQIVQREFSDPAFRIYTNDDITGVELGGALKNVIAIAAGICAGLELGHNSVAALITRGLAEMTRLTVACGGRAETLAGLAGLGDLVLTCTGSLSRNRSVGVELGRGRRLSEIVASMHGAVAEGVLTAEAALGLAQKSGVEIPIMQQMYEILQNLKSPTTAIQELMSRRAKSETELTREGL
jgi:glycerol-3-phosphate dehydrogenase (NAD(P)+)